MSIFTVDFIIQMLASTDAYEYRMLRRKLNIQDEDTSQFPRDISTC